MLLGFVFGVRLVTVLVGFEFGGWLGLRLGLVVWVCFNWFGFVMVDCWVSIVFWLLRGVVFGLCVVWLPCVVLW